MRKLYTYLAYLGALPFVLCALCLLFGVYSLPYVGDVQVLLSTYGLVIASFMAGSLWGQQFQADQQWARSIGLLTNIVTVGVWLGYLLLPLSAFLRLLVIAFVGLLVMDRKQFQLGHISKTYFSTRCGVTAVVSAALVVSFIFRGS
ncbi:DUF3429 domain-containing protein [Porticoccus sp. W117]|uniref:DUF3429 domain-containing protein n=1 Tax=Porticoccus sp. W117 TaxID=3054777 RepID=UPI0025990A6D|nr:DUF3429 domain-containing protein [Porticoccus sp. W117]MDM3872487.1 DUF3429 domain-containing protein [Porticoccus sp. W117]